MRLEKKLQKLLKESSEFRNLNAGASYYSDYFDKLSTFITKKLNNPLLKNRNAKIIANHFDEILPFIVSINMNIILSYIELLIDQPNFKEKFIAGLKNYPYKSEMRELLYNIWFVLSDSPDKYNNFIDKEVLEVLLTLNVNSNLYSDILNRANEKNQELFLKILVENKADIHYLSIKYKGNNKQIIYDNLSLYIKMSQNLYALMSFVKDNPVALLQVKEYIDNNEEQTINSIFCETEQQVKITDPLLKDFIKMLLLEVMKNENVKFSDITYNGGTFSRVLLVGNKVIKLGDRCTKKFPNNPYIISPLIRKEIKTSTGSLFVEVTERVDTSVAPNREVLYQLYKNLRNLGLIWTDINTRNVGRLLKKNIIHWNDELKPSDEVLELDAKRGSATLKTGDWVILDADFIYDEKNPNINYSNNKATCAEFEERYQREKKENNEAIYDNCNSIKCIKDIAGVYECEPIIEKEYVGRKR